MNRKEILNRADTATAAKSSEYGEPDDSFTLIGQLWGTLLGRPAIPAWQVAAMMVAFKVSRLSGDRAKADTWIDIAGYAACGGEIATRPT